MSVSFEQPRTDRTPRGCWGWFVVFGVLLLLTRMRFMKVELIDWDESTYILRGANIWDAGASRFDVWYFRPPAFTGALRIVMGVFDDSLFAVRAFGAICIFVAACLTFLICRRRFGAQASGLACAAIISGLAVPELQTTNTEQLVIALISAALWLLIAKPAPGWSAFLVGICLSLATLTRMNIAYLVIAIGCYYLVFLFRPRGPVHRLGLFAYALGGAIPVLALGIAYWHSGATDRFFLFVFGIVLSYAFEQLPMSQVLSLQWAHAIRFISNGFLVYGPIALLLLIGGIGLFLAAIRQGHGGEQKSAADDRITSVMSLAGAAVLLSILTGGAPYSHYWIQMVPFAAFLIAAALAYPWFGVGRGLVYACALVAISIPAIVYGPESVRLVAHWSEIGTFHSIRQAAGRIAADRTPGDQVYAPQAHLIHWYMREKPLSPILSHPSDIVQAPIMRPLIAAGLLSENEFEHVLAFHPRYIVKLAGPMQYMDGQPAALLFERTLAAEYELWATIENIEIYRRL